jgi:hypothetical protein
MQNLSQPRTQPDTPLTEDQVAGALPWHLRNLPEDIARRLMQGYQPKPITGRSGMKPGY